jgi:hypothetical protein
MFVFWVALSLLVYRYFGYPILAWTRAKLWPRAHHREAVEPAVTVIVVAHDEEHRIESRLDNLLSLDYPRAKLEILLASDGSTDGTVERARQYIRRGYRVCLESAARAYDATPASSHDEFVRKVRTIAGTFQLFARERWLFDPVRNPLWFETMSHKALRLAAPFLQLVLFAANLALADLWFYCWLLAAQIAFYAAALGGHAHRHARHRHYVLTVPYALCVLNWAALVGFVRFLTGQQRVTWEQVASTALASPRTRSVKAEFRL